MELPILVVGTILIGTDNLLHFHFPHMDSQRTTQNVTKPTNKPIPSIQFTRKEKCDNILYIKKRE
jgi:hypothetical protein